MLRSIRSIVLVFVFALMPRVAQAQEIDFLTQCITAPFRACATVNIQAIFHPPEEMFLGNNVAISELRFTVANLTGLPGYADGAHGLRAVRINGLNFTTGAGVDFFAQAIGSTGVATIGGAVDFPNIGYPGGGVAWASFNLDYDSYIFGCTVPVGASSFAGYDQTCGGTITYAAYFVNDQLTLSNTASADLSFGGWAAGGSFNDDGAGVYTCTTGVDCAQVTPEPITMTLMGTGMAGMAAVRALRRRKKNAQLGTG